VFHGHDIGKQKVRDFELTAPFARTMSVPAAMILAVLLCYEMNGKSLRASHGAPIRLFAVSCYGVANVTWPDRIEVIDTRFAGSLMACDEVTIREEQHDDQPVCTETVVGKALLEWAPARVTREDGAYRIMGAAWGASLASVDGQVDSGPWMAATDERIAYDFAWKLWSLTWPSPTAGEFTITFRAADVAGKVQSAHPDPEIANKRTCLESNGQITSCMNIV
jgi:DMSO/TMAO reductase YedYZ molybdopterin-dependent catalytic subunit